MTRQDCLDEAAVAEGMARAADRLARSAVSAVARVGYAEAAGPLWAEAGFWYDQAARR